MYVKKNSSIYLRPPFSNSWTPQIVEPPGEQTYKKWEIEIIFDNGIQN